MNILIAHTYYYPDIKGGAEYSVKKIAEGLAGRGHNVYILCDCEDGNKDELINGVYVLRRKMNCMRKSNNAFTKVLRAIMEFYNPLNRAIVENIFQMIGNSKTVCYTNSLRRISRVVWAVADRRKIPIIDTQREYRMLRLLPKGSWLNKIWMQLNKGASRKVKVAAFISHASKNIHLSEGFYPNAQHKVIYNSIDFDYDKVKAIVKERKKAAKSGRNFKYVYLGSLEKHKGVDVLLDAFALLAEEINGIELHIAGQGSMEKEVLEKSKNYPGIIYHGWLSEAEVSELLLACDALVCPSVWKEPFGRVVLDAYKHGMPAIVANSGGLAETVLHEKTGYILMPGDSQELYTYMSRLVKNQNEYISMCEAAYKTLPAYSLEIQLDKFENIFQEQLNKV